MAPYRWRVETRLASKECQDKYDCRGRDTDSSRETALSSSGCPNSNNRLIERQLLSGRPSFLQHRRLRTHGPNLVHATYDLLTSPCTSLLVNSQCSRRECFHFTRTLCIRGFYCGHYFCVGVPVNRSIGACISAAFCTSCKAWRTRKYCVNVSSDSCLE